MLSVKMDTSVKRSREYFQIHQRVIKKNSPALKYTHVAVRTNGMNDISPINTQIYLL